MQHHRPAQPEDVPRAKKALEIAMQNNHPESVEVARRQIELANALRESISISSHMSTTIQKKVTDEACRLCVQAARSGEKHPDGRTGLIYCYAQGTLGQLAFMVRDYQHCVEHFKLVWDSLPLHEELAGICTMSLNSYGFSLYMTGNPDLAYPVLEEAFEMADSYGFGDNVIISNLVSTGRCRALHGHLRQAAVLLQRAVNAPQPVDPLLSKMAKQALAECKHFEGFTSAEEWKQAGNKYFTDEEVGVASTLYTTALKLDPENSKVLSNRAACHMKRKQYSEALKDATAAVTVDPGFARAHLRRVEAFYFLRRYKDALDTVEMVRQQFPQEEVAVKDWLSKIHTASQAPPPEPSKEKCSKEGSTTVTEEVHFETWVPNKDLSEGDPEKEIDFRSYFYDLSRTTIFEELNVLRSQK